MWRTSSGLRALLPGASLAALGLALVACTDRELAGDTGGASDSSGTGASTGASTGTPTAPSLNPRAASLKRIPNRSPPA